MKRVYAWSWACGLCFVLAALTWTMGGRAYWRRHVVGFAGVPEDQRRSSHFVAVLFPRLSDSGEPFTMRSAAFEEVLQRLSDEGCVSIGWSDVRDFYLKGRFLPPQAVLIALDRDDPYSVALADRALRRMRMKAVVFLNITRYGAGMVRRHSLTPHAISQMAASGAWEFGWFSDDPSAPPADLAQSAVLDATRDSGWTRDCRKYPFRFQSAPTGYNGLAQTPCSLKIMRVRSDRSAEETARAIDSNWPRRKPFFDEFRDERLGTDWIVGHGVVSGAHNRLAIIPTPKQTGATVSLNGTDEWNDAVVEFYLKKYQSAFWAYLRYQDGVHFVRVGAKNGFWKVEQKPAPGLPPATLAKGPIGALPARVSFVLKNDTAIVHVNGRLQFRKALVVDPRIDVGRVELGVFDAKPKNALAILKSFRASPLAQKWVVLEKLPSDFGPGFAERLHENAVYARALTPRWFSIEPGGRLLSAGEQLELARALSGFNRAMLVPMVCLSAGKLQMEEARLSELADTLADAAQDLGVPGINLRVPVGADQSAALRVAQALRERMHARNRRLWVTIDGLSPPAAVWGRAADGVLRPVHHEATDLEVLEIYDMEARDGPRPS